MKIQRNNQCPCGSGEKYKKCCLNKPLVQQDSSYVNDSTDEIDFFNKYNTTDLLQSIAGLSILKENHGKNYRFEQITEEAILYFNTNAASASIPELRDFLSSKYPSEAMEDDPFNLFTEIVTFHGGDYIIFPGISESTSFILGSLLKAIFQTPDNQLPDEFMKIAYQASMFILEISDHIAKVNGYARYLTGEIDKGLVKFPSEERFDILKKSVEITRAEMYRLLQTFNIEKSILDSFLLEISSPDLGGRYGQDSPLTTHPIVNAQDRFVVVSPSNLSYALVEFIKSEAKRIGCYELLVEAYHDFIWLDLQLKIKKLGFTYIPLEVTENLNGPSLRYGVYKFDDDKIALAYQKYPGQSLKEKQDQETSFKTVLGMPEFKEFEILELPIVSSINEMFFAGADKNADRQTLILEASELNIISGLKDVNAIDLYKFATANDKAHDSMMVPTSFLDRFKFYQDNDNSFYCSDNAGPTSIIIEPGYGFDLLLKSKENVDLHSARFKEDGKVKLMEVMKTDKYGSTYLNLEEIGTGKLNLLVENLPVYIWISPLEMSTRTNPALNNMYWELCDAIAYWLWQLEDSIKEKLSSLGSVPIKIIFTLDDESKFAEIDRNFERDPALFDYFIVKATEDSINITIPHQILPYLYGADNEGERQLVRAILTGLNDLLISNSKPGFTKAEITSKIDEAAPLGIKKKIYVLDTNDNLLLEPKNLSGYRLVEQHDVNVVLDNIVPLLGEHAPPVGELTTKKEKEKLTSAIVQKALLPYLRTKIQQYDSTELLKRLIRINEGLINKRERLRINTPTRIACFVSVEQHQVDLAKDLQDLDKSTISVRCLIEHVTAEPYKGSHPVSKTAIDELMAIMEQILAWGSTGDQIHFDLLDIELSVLPSKRIGSKKENIRDIFDPFQSAKTEENITDAIETYKHVFPQHLTTEKKDVPVALEKAFLKDYGITFSRLCEFVEGLCHIGFLQEDACASFPLSRLNAEINKYVDSFSSDEFDNAVEFLSLRARGKVDKLPAGKYEFIDIIPWRYNRILSLLRKPLVIVDEDGDSTAYWGVRQMLQCRMTWVQQLLSGRFRSSDGSEVSKAIGKFANERGDELVKAVVKSIDPTNLIIDTDAYIKPKALLNHTEDIGDVDVLIIDQTNKILYSLECKSMSPSRNVKEMIEEVTKLFGENSSDKGWIEKHMTRHVWLENNLSTVGKVYNIDMTGFKVKSFFVTNEEMLTPHLRKEALPLPFITLYDLEKNGFSTLEKNYDHQIRK
ncbi:YecA family protein [Flavobacterium cerinum]|uniref:SEC-C domain-containing protein n=1 Tax=Flavobacterium cerinum TaxID=2502784 RepID=A0ABY5IXK4_9FLAO|nr:SEC-C domain-containing protein [Flavobacterium cerinum]UUC47171.1 SEC-C domain-containing protein [Flavobacterium cerinum]